MQVFQNSSPVFLRNNSFLENKILKNENKEERTQSNISLRNNNSILSGQENESPFGLNDEDSNNIFWHDINDFSEESTPFSINLNEKSLFDKNSSIINQSNIIEDNISIEKIEKSFSLSQNKDIINESNENEIEIFGFTHKLNEDAEKIFNKVEEGKCNYPITLSKEIISFLKGMLRADPSERLKIEDLSKHEFLTKNVKTFQIIEKKEINDLEQNFKNEGNQKLCMICFTNNPEIIICPCGHKCICILCYDKLLANAGFRKCPICNKKIESIVRKVIEV